MVSSSHCGSPLCRSLLILFVIYVGTVSATPAGFTTYFTGSSCPSGWTQLTTTQGRLILSVANGEEVGVTVNQPLLPQEDRIHEHPFSTEFDLPSKAIAADGCCNDQGASSGTYPIAGSVQSSASGLPFVQMILCTLTSSDSNPIPFGTVAYFEPTISECPSGWKAFAEAEGRFLMAGYDEKGVIVSQDLPLASGEDRTHAHPMSVDLSLNEVSYAGVDGCCNNSPGPSGSYEIATNATESSSGLPYIQLLTCVSQAPTFNATLPTGSLLFNEISCPPGWNVSYSSAGRFIVSLPSGGVAGATFGADSLEPGYTGNLIHDHQFEGQVELGSTGVGLASGCCGGGYAQSNIYYYQGTTGSDATNLPYIMIPMCVKLDEEEGEGY